MLNCKDATRRMSEAEDRELGLAERLELGVHLAMCKGCRNYQTQLRTLRNACQRYTAQLLRDNDGTENPPPPRQP